MPISSEKNLTSNTILVIIVTSLATYLSRFLGVLSSAKITENSKIFRWFNCLAYSSLAALISRMILFPNGDLESTDLLLRILILFLSIIIFILTKKNLVYPTIISSILLCLYISY